MDEEANRLACEETLKEKAPVPVQASHSKCWSRSTIIYKALIIGTTHRGSGVLMSCACPRTRLCLKHCIYPGTFIVVSPTKKRAYVGGVSSNTLTSLQQSANFGCLLLLLQEHHAFGTSPVYRRISTEGRNSQHVPTTAVSPLTRVLIAAQETWLYTGMDDII